MTYDRRNPPRNKKTGRFEHVCNFDMDAMTVPTTSQKVSAPSLNQNHEKNQLGVKMAYMNQYERKP